MITNSVTCDCGCKITLEGGATVDKDYKCFKCNKIIGNKLNKKREETVDIENNVENIIEDIPKKRGRPKTVKEVIKKKSKKGRKK